MNRTKNKNFLVTVYCWTYNHAQYIVDTLNGFTIQQTYFPYVCVIVDDASTDGEQNVIQHYLYENFVMDNSDVDVFREDETNDYVLTFCQHKRNHNCFFSVLYLKYNHYGKKDKSPYYSEWSNSEYIAYCEGDDYWTNSKKLLQQVEFLNKNVDYGLVCSNFKIYNEYTDTFANVITKAGAITFEDLIVVNSIATFTVMCRRNIWENYQKEVGYNREWLMGDYPLWLYTSKVAKLYKLENVAGVYRKHQGSASHPNDYQKAINFTNSVHDIQNYFLKAYDVKDNNIIQKVEDSYIATLFVKSYRYKEYKEAVKFFHYMKKTNAKYFIAYIISRLRIL